MSGRPIAVEPVNMSEKITRFLAETAPETPCLVVDLDVVERNYLGLAKLLPAADIYYAVKANPAPPILDRLCGLGAHFDAASIFEVESCRAAGAPPERISFGHTVKKQAHIAEAYRTAARLLPET